MPAMDATIDLQQEADYCVVTCAGDLDLHCADELRRTIGTAIRSGAGTVIVDLSNAGLVDSTALGVLLSANTSCNDAGSSLVLVGAGRFVARSIAVTGLDRVLTVLPDVAAARGLALGAGAED